jgi:hypothetical protein
VAHAIAVAVAVYATFVASGLKSVVGVSGSEIAGGTLGLKPVVGAKKTFMPIFGRVSGVFAT